MVQKKICLIGAFAVGKTSLVRQFVDSMFSEKYQTTLGVKIDKKIIQLQEKDVKLMIWDLAGEDDFMSVRMSYIRGASGILYVMDGTRVNTLHTVIELEKNINIEFGHISKVLLINKSDKKEEWEIKDKQIDKLKNDGWKIYFTSAKNTQNVNESFEYLTSQMLEA